jgi:hypothetical protein
VGPADAAVDAAALAARPSVTVVGVYRARNAELVQALVGPVRDGGATVGWWALDDVVPTLASETVGEGPGLRLPLLNAVLERRPGDPDGWLVVCDDDVRFDRGDIAQLVSIAARAELDLAQPARSERELDHEITRRWRLSTARLTSFVEIGPLFVVGPGWRHRIVPFPAERGMGWGLELDWLDLQREGCRLGIVDAVSVSHVGARGAEYDFDRHHAEVHAELARRGIGHWRDFQETFACWRPWQRSAPWASPG